MLELTNALLTAGTDEWGSETQPRGLSLETGYEIATSILCWSGPKNLGLGAQDLELGTFDSGPVYCWEY